MTYPYDKDKLFRFITSVIAKETPDQTDMDAAAQALIDLLEGKDVRAGLGYKQKQGGRKRKKNIALDQITIDDLAFSIVVGLVAKGIDIDNLKKGDLENAPTQIAKHLRVSEKTAGRYIKSLWERAKLAHNSRQQLLNLKPSDTDI